MIPREIRLLTSKKGNPQAAKPGGRVGVASLRHILVPLQDLTHHLLSQANSYLTLSHMGHILVMALSQAHLVLKQALWTLPEALFRP